MSKQASKTLIGAFVVGAIALVVTGVLVFGSGKFFAEKSTFVMYFEGSLKGLNEGSPVIFRGVRIGSVTNIILRSDPVAISIDIPVFVEIYPEKFEIIGDERFRQRTEKGAALLVERGLKAQLEMQSLVTGQLTVALDFYPDKPAIFRGDGTIPEIPTIRSGMEELAKTIEKAPVEEILNKMLSAVEGIEKVVNAPETKQILLSLEQAVEGSRDLIRNVNDQVLPLAMTIEETLEDIRKVARHIEGIVEPLISSVEKTAKASTDAIAQAQKTLISVENVTSEDSIVNQKLINALKELAAAARSVRILSEYLEQHPEALFRGKSGSGGK
ncbi:MAG: MlaD family protein [Thermodesulfobacteriota bacterium]|nr:MlaD family protein [Thermodesulfobacteriota bacterium]